ncbi:UNVERIFIED_CONTAM: hypothetical protein FKN15_028360 [Acipenser sinensis]
MDRNALAELLQALESTRDAEERRREERYTALIERYFPLLFTSPVHFILLSSRSSATVAEHSPAQCHAFGYYCNGVKQILAL